MRSSLRNFAIIAGLTAVAVLLLGRQWQAGERLRAQIAAQQRVKAEQQRLRKEQQRLQASAVLPAERVALGSLLAEIEAIRRRAGTTRPGGAVGTQASTEAPASDALAMESMLTSAVAAARWRNAGQATPEAAFETALWAAAGGDVRALTDLLALDDATRIKAAAVFARLPPPLQQELATPEQLMAFLTAYNVPLGSARIFGTTKLGQHAEHAQLAAQLTDANGQAKEILFALHADGARWQLVVPPTAVEKYVALLGGAR